MNSRSSKEELLISKLRHSSVDVFSLEKASQVLGASQQVTSQVLHRLTAKGRLRRIQKATYIVVPDGNSPKSYTIEANLVATELVRPYYLSYWTALHYYGWTEQPSKTVFIATTKLKHPVKLDGTTFKFIKLRPSRFFGNMTDKVNGHQVQVADPEKTIVDCLDQPRYCGEIVEAAKGIWNGRRQIDFEKVSDYARRMENGAIVKRLGYLMEVLGVGTRAYLDTLKKAKSAGYAALDTGVRGTGTYNTDWNLFVNVSQKNLTEWIRT